jgi:hypothetical protein
MPTVTENFDIISVRHFKKNSHFEDQQMQRGLKYTEHEQFGRHYLGVTRSTNEFAVHTLTQVKACIMEVPCA